MVWQIIFAILAVSVIAVPLIIYAIKKHTINNKK